jgi:bacillithiol synthase
MALSIHLEPVPPQKPPAPAEMLPPSLDQLDNVLAERDIFARQQETREELINRLKADLALDLAPRDCLESLDKLARPDCLAVVTGQQPGLLTGPLYIPWKVLTAMTLARRLESALQRPVVPVFWNAGEDHDTAEMNHFSWLGRSGLPAGYEAELVRPSEPIPFGTRAISEIDLEKLFQFWDENLFETQFREELKKQVEEAAGKTKDLGGWCNRLLWDLFPDSGLVVFNSHRGLYQELCREIFRKEIESPLTSAEAVNQAGRQMAQAGYPVAMHKTADRCAFFLMEEGRRSAVKYGDAAFITQTGRYSPAQLLERLEKTPADFSAAANLRPVIQDAILPTALSVLGPGEMAYHSQLGQIYKNHQVPRPCAAGRFHLTLLTTKVERGLAKTGIQLKDLEQPVEHLAKERASEQSDFDFDSPLEQLLEQTDKTLAALAGPGQNIDKSIEPAIMGTRKQIHTAVDKLKDKFQRSLRQKNEQTEKTLERLKAIVYPEGRPQERIINIYYFLNQFGPALTEELLKVLTDSQPGESYQVWIKHES